VLESRLRLRIPGEDWTNEFTDARGDKKAMLPFSKLVSLLRISSTAVLLHGHALVKFSIFIQLGILLPYLEVRNLG